jgi:aryl-alcohol dehydrogenase-like predicted oxidoreductase
VRTRFLGRSGLEVSELAFGAMNFGTARYAGVGGTMREGARSQVDMCLEAGVTLFDTADIYSDGQSEELLGEALGSRRKDVVLATKVFGRIGPAAMERGLSRRHIIASCEASLRRLGTDWIDLYQSHGWDGAVPVDETLRAFEDLIRAGKVRYIGCSNHSGWHLMKALATADRIGAARYVSQQIQYSLIVRDVEAELIPCGREEGVGGLIWSPLSQGYLTGKYRDAKAEGRLVKAGSLARTDDERARATVDVLCRIAAEHGEHVSPEQVAIAWLLHRPGVTSVLVGARTAEQLANNLRAANVVLTAEDMERLNAASAVPAPYPRSHQLLSSSDRNPPLPAMVKRLAERPA